MLETANSCLQRCVSKGLKVESRGPLPTVAMLQNILRGSRPHLSAFPAPASATAPHRPPEEARAGSLSRLALSSDKARAPSCERSRPRHRRCCCRCARPRRWCRHHCCGYCRPRRLRHCRRPNRHHRAFPRRRQCGSGCRRRGWGRGRVSTGSGGRTWGISLSPIGSSSLSSQTPPFSIPAGTTETWAGVESCGDHQPRCTGTAWSMPVPPPPESPRSPVAMGKSRRSWSPRRTPVLPMS